MQMDNQTEARVRWKREEIPNATEKVMEKAEKMTSTGTAELNFMVHQEFEPRSSPLQFNTLIRKVQMCVIMGL